MSTRLAGPCRYGNAGASEHDGGGPRAVAHERDDTVVASGAGADRTGAAINGDTGQLEPPEHVTPPGEHSDAGVSQSWHEGVAATDQPVHGWPKSQGYGDNHLALQTAASLRISGKHPPLRRAGDQATGRNHQV